MSIAVDEVRDSIELLQDKQRQSLASFIALDAALTALAVPFVLVVYLTVATEPYLLVTGLAVAVAASVMAVGISHARSNRLSAAVGWLATGNWLAILTGVATAAPVWPLFRRTATDARSRFERVNLEPLTSVLRTAIDDSEQVVKDWLQAQ